MRTQRLLCGDHLAPALGQERLNLILQRLCMEAGSSWHALLQRHLGTASPMPWARHIAHLLEQLMTPASSARASPTGPSDMGACKSRDALLQGLCAFCLQLQRGGMHLHQLGACHGPASILLGSRSRIGLKTMAQEGRVLHHLACFLEGCNL